MSGPVVRWLALVVATVLSAGCAGLDVRAEAPTDGAASARTLVASSTPGTPAVGDCANAALFRDVAVEALDGLMDTTAAEPWSEASIDLTSGAAGPDRLTIAVAWQGTLIGYEALAGAERVTGLADEAYRFDRGHQLAMRSGEVVAVIGWAVDRDEIPAPGTDAFAAIAAPLVVEAADGAPAASRHHPDAPTHACVH